MITPQYRICLIQVGRHTKSKVPSVSVQTSAKVPSFLRVKWRAGRELDAHDRHLKPTANQRDGSLPSLLSKSHSKSEWYASSF